MREQRKYPKKHMTAPIITVVRAESRRVTKLPASPPMQKQDMTMVKLSPSCALVQPNSTGKGAERMLQA